MFEILDKNNSVTQQIIQYEKEIYIVNMLIRTLYSNDVNKDECYRIIEKFKEKALNNT